MRALVLLCLMISFSANANLQESEYFSTELNQQFEKVRPAAKPSLWSFQAAIQTADYSYKEPGLMKMEGLKSGVGFVAQKFDSGQVHSKRWVLTGDYYSGTVDYTGATMNLNTGERKPATSQDTSYFYNLTASRSARLMSVGSFIPWIGAGLGYRFLVTKPKNANPSDYRREQSYLYLPITGELARKLRPSTTLQLATEVDIFLRGGNTSYIFGEMKFRQSSGSGLGFSGTVTEDFSPTLSAFVTLKYHRWSIAASDLTAVSLSGRTYHFLEPKNYTEQTGLSVGMYF